MDALKTKKQQDRERTDLAIFNEYKSLTSTPGRSKVEVKKFLAEKYGYYSISAVYDAIKRVEKKIKSGEA